MFHSEIHLRISDNFEIKISNSYTKKDTLKSSAMFGLSGILIGKVARACRTDTRCDALQGLLKYG